MIVFALWGVAIGLWQQLPGLPADKIDCELRVELMQERLLALMDRPQPRNWLGSPTGGADPEAHDDFANLLRETHAACHDASPDVAHELERIDEFFVRERNRRKDASAAREELSALQGSSR
ncbi:hypothetical protein G6O69_27900 [Pseudenhygromyxa sp. WMMC2535]|uniref:hypothetical protein n=1 Tax=Pseudenhygromyxa sp. WMMC2535 TaxID=2712867 RepID=UPI0015517C1C|nr:hypothetical protein [Pseudenhygromyxa sp. WMMC2535]NVB41692.1 hypothetical protein [Pseudenhygromyxa sp. WMMC2535]